MLVIYIHHEVVTPGPPAPVHGARVPTWSVAGTHGGGRMVHAGGLLELDPICKQRGLAVTHQARRCDAAAGYPQCCSVFRFFSTKPSARESSKVKFIPVALPAPPSQVAHGLGQLTEQRAASRACKGNLRVLQGEPGVRRARGARRAARGWQRPCRPGSSELLVLTELSTGL